MQGRDLRPDISIHALCEEGDPPVEPKSLIHFYFYPRPLRGGRPDYRLQDNDYSKFLSTPSARRATHRIQVQLRQLPDFYPRPLRGGRPGSGSSMCCGFYFYPRPLRGGRPPVVPTSRLPDRFLSTPSARRATATLLRIAKAQNISIHALCEEGDLQFRQAYSDAGLFLSTPSARRATARSGHQAAQDEISIHALCEEGDAVRILLCAGTLNFYPRPLRGGRPCACWEACDTLEISIHALCEEGDLCWICSHREHHYNFYPRPLRGGRRFCCWVYPATDLFLSTPSARRAT